MSEASRSTPESSSSGAATSGSGRSILRAVLYFSIAVALAIIGYAGFRATQDRAAMNVSTDRLIAVHGLIHSAQKHLAPEYSDAKGRLLADPPTDSKQLLDPDILTLAHYQDADVDIQPIDWDDLQAQLAKSTGKNVVGQ
jgi:hypothetical protein